MESQNALETLGLKRTWNPDGTSRLEPPDAALRLQLHQLDPEGKMLQLETPRLPNETDAQYVKRWANAMRVWGKGPVGFTQELLDSCTVKHTAFASNGFSLRNGGAIESELRGLGITDEEFLRKVWHYVVEVRNEAVESALNPPKVLGSIETAESIKGDYPGA